MPYALHASVCTRIISSPLPGGPPGARDPRADGCCGRQELLDAHDALQGKWRDASKEVALQSQRYIEELRTEKARLEARNKELNNKLATVLVEKAGSASMSDQHERQMARLRVLLDAAEKRAQVGGVA